MRVLIDYRAALRHRSGVGEYTHGMVRALLDTLPAGTLDITLFSSSWRDRLSRPADLAGVGIVDRRVPVRLLNLLWHRAEWPPAELLARDRFDVTHSMHPLMMPTRGAARVITIHDLNFLTHADRTRAEIRRDYPVLARKHAHRADAIVVPSKFTAREVERQLGVPVSRISVCSPGAPDWEPRERAPVDGYALFLGTLEPRKNVGGLLDAYERLASRRPVPQLLLAGRAIEGSEAWLDRINRPPLNRVVRHVGYVDPANRRELYTGACMLIQPSHDEGFGLPVLEACTLGVPVIAADRGALPEVLGDAGLLVDPDSADAMASAIERLLDDEAFAAAAAAKGILQARRFRWSDTAVRVYDTYRQALGYRACASA